MSHFAQIQNGIVIQVIVVEPHQIEAGEFGNPDEWLQTSYNTSSGVHYGEDGNPDGGVALRKNFAGVGYTYDESRDAFIPPQPFPSWALDEQTCWWTPPSPMPDDGNNYDWDEGSLAWVLITE
jgi:hypothetical protein